MKNSPRDGRPLHVGILASPVDPRGEHVAGYALVRPADAHSHTATSSGAHGMAWHGLYMYSAVEGGKSLKREECVCVCVRERGERRRGGRGR